MTSIRNRFVTYVLPAVLAAVAAVASAEMTGRQVIEKSLAAQGGKANLEKVQTRSVSAKVEVKGLSGTYQLWAKAPDKVKTLLDLGVLQQERAYDGAKGWQKQNSLEEVVGYDLARLKRSAVFAPLLTYAKDNAPAELKGKETLNGAEVYKVEIKPQPEQVETFYFDAKTFLPVREMRPVMVNLQKTDLVIDYADYRKVDAIKLPFKTIQTMGDQVLTLAIDAYVLNATIDDSMFKSPAEQFANEPYDVTLLTMPEHIYKENDGIWEPGPTESWSFHLVIREKHGRPLNAVAARIEFFSEDQKVSFVEMASDALDSIRGVSFGGFANVDEVFDLSHSFSQPVSTEIDKMVYRINLVSPAGEKFQKMLEIPVTNYEQKTKLIFPVKGKFMVGAGHDFNEPHKDERSQQYAYDILALGEHYELYRTDGLKNDDFYAYGHEVIAPADGKVVYARNDVPDNTAPGKVDTHIFMKMPDPERSFAGNNVIIDHGNGEFSALAHLKTGSVRVKAGDTVKQGDVIGLLGNSGNSDGPHLHYQLMAGDRIFHFDGLPSKFENVVIETLTAEVANVAIPKRGVWLVAK